MSLDEVSIDGVDELSVDKIINFISKTKNPYIFKVNGRLVKIEFCNNGKKAEDSITSVIKSIYK